MWSAAACRRFVIPRLAGERHALASSGTVNPVYPETRRACAPTKIESPVPAKSIAGSSSTVPHPQRNQTSTYGVACWEVVLVGAEAPSDRVAASLTSATRFIDTPSHPTYNNSMQRTLLALLATTLLCAASLVRAQETPQAHTPQRAWSLADRPARSSLNSTAPAQVKSHPPSPHRRRRRRARHQTARRPPTISINKSTRFARYVDENHGKLILLERVRTLKNPGSQRVLRYRAALRNRPAPPRRTSCLRARRRILAAPARTRSRSLRRNSSHHQWPPRGSRSLSRRQCRLLHARDGTALYRRRLEDLVFHRRRTGCLQVRRSDSGFRAWKFQRTIG